MFLRPILALVVLASATGLAHAQYGSKHAVVIRNSTAIPIAYDSTFDTGAPLKVVLQPGDAKVHYCDAVGLAPRVTISFYDLVPYTDFHHVNVFTDVVSDFNIAPTYQFTIRDGRLYLVR